MIASRKINPMNSRASRDPELQVIMTTVRTVAQASQSDILALLGLLRVLEELHREIRDDLFQEALPSNRQELYRLVREIESAGGWPYIPRFQLQALLTNLEPGEFEQEKPPGLI
ncbi:hypothetical protein AVDCRST_MAG81-4136 [uncultured Synechococcales cyanobacterium]|uniref:Uncharacterized protein n=1 Tax=uncultured Synechococcales cyanobacterium TaxID=1936017 RepID=A0A6J4VQ32_9CYAN|nr:hypothetical protein AVDCRST_MAG81-4136 [uncultured Synechococcales cyanobacterium]